MGVELVEGRDLIVDNHRVFMKTTVGLQQVDVIYRRVDDDFLDPLVFDPDSTLGVSGISPRTGPVMWRSSMHFGNGVADDKAIYIYVPAMIRYYLNETDPEECTDIPVVPKSSAGTCFDNINRMVREKDKRESGGYGMLMGNSARNERSTLQTGDTQGSPPVYRPADHQPVLCALLSRGRMVPLASRSSAFALCPDPGIQIVPGRPDPGGPAAKDRWSSTPRRGEAARIPGSFELIARSITPFSDSMLSRVAEVYIGCAAIWNEPTALRMLRINVCRLPGRQQNFSWKPVLNFHPLGHSRSSARIPTIPAVLVMVTEGEPEFRTDIGTLSRENARASRTISPKELWQCLNEFYHLSGRRGSPAG